MIGWQCSRQKTQVLVENRIKQIVLQLIHQPATRQTNTGELASTVVDLSRNKQVHPAEQCISIRGKEERASMTAGQKDPFPHPRESYRGPLV